MEMMYFFPLSSLSLAIVEVTSKKLRLKKKSVTQKIEVEEAKPEEPEQKVTFKITKKKKSVAEMELKTEPEKEPEAFKVQLKKRKKKKVHQAQEVEERIPVEEVTEFSRTPTEVIEFIDIEDGLPSTEITTEGLTSLHLAWLQCERGASFMAFFDIDNFWARSCKDLFSVVWVNAYASYN